MLSYKGYLGIVEFDEENNSFFGKVLGIRQLVSFEAENAQRRNLSINEMVGEALKNFSSYYLNL